MATTTIAAPIIQVLSRKNYEDQYLVSLPNTIRLPELAPGSIRVKTSILSLTANTLMYGRIGHILGMWPIHPLPTSVPAQYSDPEKFGRIGTWAYATVLGSNVSEIDIGSQVFGYLPIGTLPLDMKVQVNPEVPGQFSEISKHRENAMSLYNQYAFYPSLGQRTLKQKETQGYDTLFQIFFTTSYLMNRFVFPWDPTEFVHPGSVEDDWTPEKGYLDDKTTVLVFADSGKTALALAWLLKNGRPASMRPQMVVGIGAGLSRAFSLGTGFYDKVLTYDADSGDLDRELGLNADSKVILCEFGSRGSAAERWDTKLRQNHRDVVQMIVGGEVVPDSPEKAKEKFLARTKKAATVFNASRTREQALKVLGGKRYSQELHRDWSVFKELGVVNGLHMVWGDGMESVGTGWETLCNGGLGSEKGLVFSLD